MRAKLLMFCLCFLLVVESASQVTTVAAAGDETIAIVAAEQFLGLIDKDYYTESWRRAATILRRDVPKKQWVSWLKGLRPALGTVLKRSVVEDRTYTSLPGGPEGAYVVVQFETSFAHKRQAVEIVTSMREADGNWRVIGYNIR